MDDPDDFPRRPSMHPTIRRAYELAFFVCALGAALGSLAYWRIFVLG